MDKLFKHVVFIDDDLATNYYHEIIVRDSGLVEQVDFFDSPLSALEYFDPSTSNNKIPELLFLDINMPIINGWEFLDQLSTMPLVHYPFIAMLTTSINPDDRDRANANHLVGAFYTKPLETTYLKDLHRKIQVHTA